jgi:hypothetical protein
VDTGSREENASKQESRASVLIQSEPIVLSARRQPYALTIAAPRFDLTAAPASSHRIDKEPAMSKPTIEQTRMGSEGIAFCIARTLIERDPSLKAPMRANLRKMWELLEEREDHGAADMVDTMIKALNDPAFFKP